MATNTRDSAVQYLVDFPEKYFTVDEIVAVTKMERNGTAGALSHLHSKSILTRRKRDGSSAYEYTVGPRIKYWEKHKGHKFPYHIKNPEKTQRPAKAKVRHSAAVPAANGEVGIIMKFDGMAYAITMATARDLYLGLKALFNE